MKRLLIEEINNQNKEVLIKGRVENVRSMGGLKFITIRDRTGVIQVIDESSQSPLKKNQIVQIVGNIVLEPQAPKGYEIKLKDVNIYSTPKEGYPISMKEDAPQHLETILDNRSISVRNPRIQKIFLVQQTIAEAFRDYLRSESFVEIFTPKIVSQGAESGSTVFQIQYFENIAFLAQSPQFYKQIMVGSGLERVFEIGHVYRAEKHRTSRHLNEYVSMDYEMAFIDSFHDIMDVEEKLIKYILNTLENKHGNILADFNVKLPQFDKIPRISLADMKKVITEKYGKSWDGIDDIDPEGERLATKIAQEQHGSDAVFLTHYPISARPFYTMLTPDNPEVTESFDLIMNGVEVTTGGQRIHDYEFLRERMKKYNVSDEANKGYLAAFKYGMPPHGGLGMGLERLTAQILQLENVKEASLFPRDRKRFTP